MTFLVVKNHIHKNNFITFDFTHLFSAIVYNHSHDKNLEVNMSLEDSSKEESELAQKPTENQTKQLKDRKNRKDKVKPLAKVMFFFLNSLYKKWRLC